MKRAAIYIRMSTEDQPDSPERQRSQILPHCEKLGVKVVKEYVDLAQRGWDPSRSEFQRMLADAKARQFDIIVVDEVSRLSRQSPLDYIQTVACPLRDAGVVI